MPRAWQDGIREAMLRSLLGPAATHSQGMDSPWRGDDLRVLQRWGARLVGRAAHLWMVPAGHDDERYHAKGTGFGPRHAVAIPRPATLMRVTYDGARRRLTAIDVETNRDLSA